METETYKGFFVRPNNANDKAVVDAIYERDDYAVQEVIARTIMPWRARERPLAVDCGAHIGTFSRRWHDSVPEGMVVAIEQDTENVELLKLNCQSFSRIVHGVLIGRSQREGEYDISDLLDYRPPNSVPVVLKLDVEGFELDVIRNTDPILLCRFLVIVGEYHGAEGAGIGSGIGSSGRYTGAPGGRDHFFRLVREKLPNFWCYEAKELSHFLLYNYSWWHRHGKGRE